MKNLFFYIITLFIPYTANSQDLIKHSIVIDSGFVSLSNKITKIDSTGNNIYVKIGTENELILKNSELNREFISYISSGDMIVLSYEDNVQKVAIIKSLESEVRVKIYYNNRPKKLVN